MGDEGSEWGVRVGTFKGDLRACTDGPAAYVEEDEGGDEDRVEGDVLLLHVLVQDGALVEGKVVAAGQGEAADDERDDADEHERS